MASAREDKTNMSEVFDMDVDGDGLPPWWDADSDGDGSVDSLCVC